MKRGEEGVISGDFDYIAERESVTAQDTSQADI
jgi:hypothetical protein